MAFPGGIDWVAKQAAIQQWVVAGTGLPDGSVYWGQQNRAARHAEPAVEMRLSIIDDVGLPWLDVQANPATIGPLTVSAVAVAPASTLTVAAHGLGFGDGPVQVASTGAVPGGLAALTDFWAIPVDANTLQLAATFPNSVAGDPAGSAAVPVAITSTGSGTITLAGTANTLKDGAELAYLSRAVVRAVLTLTSWTTVGVGLGMATSILRNLAGRTRLPSVAAILQGANIGLTDFQRVLAIHGVTDAVRFEPRATCEIYLNLASEDQETGGVIDYMSGTDDITGQPFKIG